MKINDIINEAKLEPGEKRRLMVSLMDRRKELNNYFQQNEDNLTNKEFNLIKDKWKKLSKRIQELGDSDDVETAKMEKVKRLFKTFDKRCSQIMSVYRETDSLLYRGLRDDHGIFVSKPRVDRTPLDSGKLYHDIINDRMKKAGFEARRDNATFVTSKKYIANKFGANTYIIIPFDGFSFTWSQSKSDIVLASDTMSRMVDLDIIRPLIEFVYNDPEIRKEYSNRFAELDFYQKPVDESLQEFKQDDRLSILLRIISKLPEGAIPPNLLERLYYQNNVTVDSMQEVLQYTDKNLEEAIKKGHEIYITGQFFALPVAYEQEFKEYLGQ